MTKYIFFNIPAHGHINPTLAVVKELVARGDQVIYYLTEEYRVTIETIGATFRSYDSQLSTLLVPPNIDMNRGTAGLQNMLPFRMADEGAYVIPQIIDSVRAEAADFIAYDMMCIWAKIIARSLQIPAIVLRPSYANNEHFQMARSSEKNGFTFPAEVLAPVNAKLTALCDRYEVTPFSFFELFAGKEPLNIVFIPREFQPFGETFDESFVFAGPSIQPRHDSSNFPFEKLAGKTVLYISMGTVFNQQTDFYNMCFEAFKDKPWLVVLSYGKRVDPATLDPTPDNFLVAPQIPQLEVLAQSHAFISHGGMNSTMESLYYGVPLIAIPQMPEQAMTAQRIQGLQLGLALDKNKLTVETLRESTEQIINNPTYLARIQKMQQYVRNAGGYKQAVDKMQEFAHAQHK